jgi:hypothetical protein
VKGAPKAFFVVSLHEQGQTTTEDSSADGIKHQFWKEQKSKDNLVKKLSEREAALATLR